MLSTPPCMGQPTSVFGAWVNHAPHEISHESTKARKLSPCMLEASEHQARPADQKREAADWRDGAEHRRAGEREQVEAAREDDDADDEAPSRPCESPSRPSATSSSRRARIASA